MASPIQNLNKSDDEKLLESCKKGKAIGLKRTSDYQTTYKAIVINIDVACRCLMKELMLPFVRNHIHEYLAQNFSDVECQQSIHDLVKQAQLDKTQGLNVPQVSISDKTLIMDNETKEEVINHIVKNVNCQMDSDRKIAPLEKIQGLVWRKGFMDGKLKGKVYEDVLPVLKQWASKNIDLFICSSGSIATQKLFFQYSNYGDLLQYFKDHFDDTIGSKLESESYQRIANQIKHDVIDILFLTNNVKEARAAKLTGMKTIMLVRPGNEPLTDEDKLEFTCCTSFDEIDIVNLKTAKSAKLD